MTIDATDLGVYRAPMRSRRPDAADGAAVERALARGLCGFGGELASPPSDLDDAIQRATREHDDRLARRIRRFADVPDGAYVWTRDVDGLYWLGRLAGAWRYDASVEAAEVDLVHVRPCTWLPAPTADAQVPSGVLATFARGGKNWQQTHDDSAARESASLWRRER